MTIVSRLLCALGLASTVHASEVALKEGDRWSYASRPGEEAFFLVIRKIEHIAKVGDVAHISVFGVHIKNHAAPGGYSSEIAHLPIAAESLRKSVKQKLEKSAPQCDWQSGYKMWHEAEAGAFTEPVSECVKFVEETLARGRTKV